MRWSKVVQALFMIVFGLVCLVITNPWDADDRPYRGGVTTTAGLSEVTSGKDDSNIAWYQGVYEFSGPGGAKFTVPGRTTEQAESRLARTVEVSYRDGDPATARVLPKLEWAWLLFPAVGALIVFVGAFRLIGALLPERRRPEVIQRA